MAASDRLIAVAMLMSAVASGTVTVKREIPHHVGSGYYGLNGVESFGHHSAFKLPVPSAYSTITYVQSHHSKPVSYSGFTNHGRGHHDPGFAIEYRSEGFESTRGDFHHHHHY